MAVIKDKILVIEDEKSINYLIGTVLTANGYDVIKAYTGTEACQMLDAYCPDLIILDLGLPDMDGVDIIRRIRGWSVVPIIVVSARTRERDKIEALDLGADDYLTNLSAEENCWRVSAPLCAIPGHKPPILDWRVQGSTGVAGCESILTAIWYGWEKRTCI